MAKNLSFLPEDYLEARMARRTNAVCLTLFVVVLGVVGAAFVVRNQTRVEVRALQRQVNADYEAAAKRLQQLDELTKRREQMMRKARVTAVLVERLRRSVILAELTNHMPATLSLTDLELDTKAIRPTRTQATNAIDRAKENAKRKLAGEPEAVEVTPTRVSINLIGVAPTDVQVAQFMTSLSRHPMFGDVNLIFSETVMLDDTPMRRFRIELTVNNEFDPEQFEPMLAERDLKQNPMGGTIQINAQGQLVVPVDQPLSDAGEGVY